MKKTYEVTLPINVFADSPDSFNDACEFLSKIGISGVKYKEIPTSGYEAVLYIGAFKGEAKKMFDTLVKEYARSY